MLKKAPSQPVRPADTPSRRASYAKSRDTRARILAAALEEASHSGFHKTSLARIAVRAGVAVGNLNYHFGSRRELPAGVDGLAGGRSHVASACRRPPTERPTSSTASGPATCLPGLSASESAHVRLADEIKLHEPGLYQRAVAGWWSE